MADSPSDAGAAVPQPSTIQPTEPSQQHLSGTAGFGPAQPLTSSTGYVLPPAPSGAVAAQGATANKPANLAVGIAMGTLLGLGAAIVYAVVTIFAEREFAVLALLVGFAIAYGFHKFGRTRGTVPGIIAAFIALVLFFLAIFIETAGAVAKYQEVSFVDGLRAAVQNPDLVVSGYFSDVLSYVFLVATVFFAYRFASDSKAVKAEEAAVAAQKRVATSALIASMANDAANAAANDAANSPTNGETNEPTSGA